MSQDLREFQRTTWDTLSNEVREKLGEIAFTARGMMSPEFIDTLQDLALEDLHRERGGNDE